MGEIIQVDFQKKCKVESYTITQWKCMVCTNDFELDSRNKSPVKRILVREATKGKEAEHICKDCCIQLGNIAKQEGWVDGAN